eukprot:gnl/TRDRNA2_/TRDRNA2_173068_c0_seq1.p1 gnl/TRDRNA2_/TRDRNA2_173068_c0~~gnl/TRDRNA2_/TRDRNA2_173068_c0_seq1.p1  ORF type:complete len:172 (+),score=14.77 gnl/TRDRNA2_/TRDRNA2_173068_c0_seq1:3-518(+)
MTAFELMQLALKRQQSACSLRAEKYAVPKMSKTAVFSFKSSLETLAKVLQVMQTMDNTKSYDDVIGKLKEQSQNLLLQREPSFLRSLEAGEELSTEDKHIVDKERHACAAVKRFLLSSEPTIISVCMECRQKPATHKGFVCRCVCLCEGCAEPDALIQCPMCHDFTEFVRA